MTRRYVSALLAFAAMIFAVGPARALATLPGEPPVEDRQPAAAHQTAAPLDEPLVSGRVVAVDRAAGRITLEYRPIPELVLEGGRRVFNVADPMSLKGLGPGDKVRFEVERNGRTFKVTRIENSN